MITCQLSIVLSTAMKTWSMDPETLAQHAQRRHEMNQHTLNAVLLILTQLITVIMPMLIDMLQPYYQKQLYHTSILSGYGWVTELLNGHPEWIQTELGMHKHIFLEFVDELRLMGYSDARDVILEEKLAIFLYACITGLSVQHLGEVPKGEWYNHKVHMKLLLHHSASDSCCCRYFWEMVDTFSFAPFYTKYVKQPTVNDPPSSFFKDNSKMWPFFWHALVQSMDAISPSILLHRNRRYTAIIKDSVPRMAFSVAHFPYILLILLIHLQGGRDQAQMLKYLKMPSHPI